MISFAKPQLFNGEQFAAELAEAGLVIDSNSQLEINVEKDLLIIYVNPENEDLCRNVLTVHEPINKVLTLEEKLALIGLSLNDLKAALEV